MKKEPKIFVGHILDSINKILDFTKDQSEVQFSRDDKTQSAVLHQFGIIGEATKNISSDIQLKYPDVVWKIMASTRDKIVHEYFGINMGIIWQTIKNDLPLLKTQIKKILKDLEK